MKNKILIGLAALTLVSAPAWAKGLDKALKLLNPDDLTTVTDDAESGDYVYRYDADEENVVKYDATDLSAQLPGLTASAAELNYNDITTLGTVQASKALTADANNDVTFPATFAGTVASSGTLTFASGSTLTVAGTLATTGSVTATGLIASTRAPTADAATTTDGATVTFTTPVDTTGTNVHNGIRVIPTIGNATGGTNTFDAFEAVAITGDAQVTEIGFKAGSGYDIGVQAESIKVNSTNGTTISAIRIATDTDLDNGQTSEVVTVTGATSASLCFATITNDSTNEVSVTNVVAGTDQATVQVSADPGASGADLAVVCYN